MEQPEKSDKTKIVMGCIGSGGLIALLGIAVSIALAVWSQQKADERAEREAERQAELADERAEREAERQAELAAASEPQILGTPQAVEWMDMDFIVDEHGRDLSVYAYRVELPGEAPERLGRDDSRRAMLGPLCEEALRTLPRTRSSPAARFRAINVGPAPMWVTCYEIPQ